MSKQVQALKPQILATVERKKIEGVLIQDTIQGRISIIQSQRILKQRLKTYICQITNVQRRNLKTLEFGVKEALVINSKLCFSCPQAGHLTKGCDSKSTCNVCNGQHNSLIHNEIDDTRIESALIQGV